MNLQDLDPSRPGRLGFRDVQDPDDPDGEQRITAWIVKSDLSHKVKYQPWIAFNVETALEVLQSPDRIYRGTRKDGDETWHGTSYVARPTHYRNDSGDRLPLPEDRIYFVFVRESGDIHEWGKEEHDGNGGPLKEHERFQEQIWPKAKK